MELPGPGSRTRWTFTVLAHASVPSRLNAWGQASLGALSLKFIDRLSQCCVQIGAHKFPHAEVDEGGLGALVPSLPSTTQWPLLALCLSSPFSVSGLWAGALRSLEHEGQCT